MDLLHNFLTQKCKFDGQDFSFKTFKMEWKKHRMNYIFLIKAKGEPLSHFMDECNEYLTNCIYYNVVNDKLSDLDFQLSTYCMYILYVLITNQPCFEDNSAASYVYLPEYTWNALNTLIHFAETNQARDLIRILKHMMKNDYFIYCIERPIAYSTSKTDPYSKNGKSYCHGTRSRILLTPTDLVSVMDVLMLTSHRNRYQQALENCGSEFTDNSNNTNPFISRLRHIRSDYQQNLAKLQKYRSHSHKQLDEMKFPLDFDIPSATTPKTLDQYYKCCGEYKAVIDVFTLDKAKKIANDIGDGDNGNEDVSGTIVKQQNESEPAVVPMVVPPFPSASFGMNGEIQFTARPLPPNIDLNTTIAQPPLTLFTSNDKSNDKSIAIEKDKQFAEIFGHNNSDDDEAEVWDDSSTEHDEGGEEEEEEEEEYNNDKNKNKKQKKKKKKKKKKKEKRKGLQLEEEKEEKNEMFEISAQNNRETLDILRSLDQMEEHVTNKKLETSTIQKLDINWKNHRKQNKNKQDEKRRKKKNKKNTRKAPKKKIKRKKSGDIDHDSENMNNNDHDHDVDVNIVEMLNTNNRNNNDDDGNNIFEMLDTNNNDNEIDIDMNAQNKESNDNGTQALLDQLEAFSSLFE